MLCMGILGTIYDNRNMSTPNLPGNALCFDFLTLFFRSSFLSWISPISSSFSVTRCLGRWTFRRSMMQPNGSVQF